MTLTYKERLQVDYERIRTATKAGALPLPQRMDEIRQATDRYALAHAEEYDEAVAQALAEGRSPGTVPIPFKDTEILEWITDAILHEDLTDKTPYKTLNTEYPFFSERMLLRKTSKDSGIDEKDKETERLSMGYRRMRNKHEVNYVNAAVKARNREARKRYNDFVRGKTEGVLNVVIKEEE